MRHVVVALLASIGLWALFPGTAVAASPHAATAYRAPQSAPAAAPAAPLREVFGFALASSLNDPTVGYPSWNFSLLTTVAFFGLHVQDDGTFAGDAADVVWNSSEIPTLLSLAHAHGGRVVLTVVMQDFSAGAPHECAALSHYPVTVRQTIAEVRAKGVDGINVDYEGLNGSCGTADPSWARHQLTAFVASLHANLWVGSELTVDTYASSAADPLGFMDVGAMASSVDGFFVMAYDTEYSNYWHPPTSCSTFCLGPTAPLGGYYYNDTSIMSQYTSAVPASKVILGVPYYGRKACVAGATPNAIPIGSVVADSYLDAQGELTAAGVQPGSYVGHRDANDPAGAERWDTWFNTSMNCTRELYWDDDVALGRKYALVNQDNLRGVGIWNLNYGGGAQELWSLIATNFSCTTSITVPSTLVGTEYTIQLSAGGCAVSYYDIQAFDSTLNQGWFNMPAVGPSGTTIGEGYQGHTYQLMARAHAVNGLVGPWTQVTTQVSPTATKGHAWNGLYTLDAYGGLHPADSPPLGNYPYWSSPIARAVKAQPGPSAPQTGLVLDPYGGLHPYGGPGLAVGQGPYYAGQDVARDFVFVPSATGGYELDAYGGIHPYSIGTNPMPPAPIAFPYFAGRDVAKKLVLLPDGSGGYVLDVFGGLHPWAVAGHSLPAAMAAYGYWANSNIARDVWLAPDSTSTAAHGYVIDAYGGFHAFWTAGASAPASIAVYGYWAGRDIARAVWFLPTASASQPSGYTLDAYGGIHPFAGAGQALPPAIAQYGYWPGQDVARALWGA